MGRLAFEAYSFVRAKYGLDDSWDDAGVKTRAVCVDVVRIGHTAGVAAERAKWEHDRDCRQHALDTARIEVARHEQIVRMHRAELDAARGLRAELARLRERERVLIDCVHAASDALGNVVSTPGGNVDNAKNALDPVRLWSYPAAAPEATLQARLDAATECERLRGEVAGLREHMRSVIAAYDDDATSHRISPAHEAARAVALRTAVEDARTALAKPTAAPEAARGGEKG